MKEIVMAMEHLRDQYRERASRCFDRMDLKTAGNYRCRADGVQDAIDLIAGKEKHEDNSGNMQILQADEDGRGAGGYQPDDNR